MDDEKTNNQEPEQKEVSEQTKEAVSAELESFINQEKKTLPVQEPAPAPLPEKEQMNVSEETPVLETEKISKPINPLSFSSVPYTTKKESPTNGEEKPIIRTYQSDVEESIKAGHISSINMAVSENKRMVERAQKPQVLAKEKPKKNKTLLVISLILIVCGLAAVAVPYFLIKKQTQPAVQNVQSSITQSIITSDIEEKINLANLTGGKDLRARVEQSATSLGQVKDFLIVKGSGENEKVVSSVEFLNLLKAKVPSDISRALKQEFVFGMHNFNGNQEFIVLKTESYEATFSGMLSWEPYLWQDFKDIFGLKEETTATSTTVAEESRIEVKKFQDAQFSNKDCRVVRDSSGNIVFLYSITNENTVVITTNTNTLKEMIARMSTARVITQ